jgi:hypothetical protein
MEVKGFQIVVLDRGWVYVGQVSEDGDYIVIKNARCIRFWGTTKGLGEIAMNGPTEATRMDYAGTVVVPKRAVIHFIACKQQF